MSQFDHWMKFNVGDYLADTMDLSTFQHGIYVRLIMHCFKRGALPATQGALMRIAGIAHTSTWKRSSPPVMALFKLVDGVWRHTRIDAERQHLAAVSEANSRNGKAGSEARWAGHRGHHRGVTTEGSSQRGQQASQPIDESTGGDGERHPTRARDSELEPELEESPSVGSRTAGTGARANGSNPRAEGTNPRATGTNPRAMGTNLRANGFNPRAQRPNRNAMLDIILEEQEASRHAAAADARASGQGMAAVAVDLDPDLDDP